MTGFPNQMGHQGSEPRRLDLQEVEREFTAGNVPCHDLKTAQMAHLLPMEGWRLWTTVAMLCIGLLLSTLETTIVATALIPISSSLGDYEKSNWIVVSYLLTYTGFLIIFARASDIFGRRSIFLLALMLFTLFSLACGVSQTMNQLIILRAFQGIGGAGIYSMAMTVMTEIPGKARGPVAGLIASIFAVSSIAGPPLGGAITSTTTWRWVFLINVPIGATVVIVVAWLFPKNATPLRINLSSFGRIDWPGAILSLAGSVLIIYALEQGGSEYAWDSAPIIVSFVIQGLCWAFFAAWEAFLTFRSSKSAMLPIFPARLVIHRVIASAMVTAFLTGFPFMATIIFLPQRFQLENDLSAVAAGVRMLALLLLSAFGAGLGGAICSKKNISFWILVVSLAFQVLGLGLMSSLPNSEGISARQYVYQCILGLGFGLSLSSLALVARFEVKVADHAVSMGAITQIRVLGGVIGIAISQAILSSHVRNSLREVLSPQQLTALLHSTEELKNMTPAQARTTRETYGQGFKLQTRAMLYIAVASFIISIASFKKNPISIQGKEDEDLAELEELAHPSR